MSELEYPRVIGVAPGNGYSHVVTGSGQWVAISGQVALDVNGEFVGRDDPTVQTEQVFANLERCLASVGATFSNIVKLTYFVTDITHLPEIRVVRDKYITGLKPASSAVQVASLFSPLALIEIEAFAII
ncbi:enamine deaminase RidA (YjgF/YER057c/UK114 family) [Kribbella sp. VKM Ac-2569]|uniref:RidA family protein n=1 Tax=Kribbella sp. VKM Ac-2569 TaxID=2512220 RepID=UPI00102D22CA|nr:RidA family protein [Kribbella sp. VKM Ac-2569]RZT07892.1 enamine deaminase RidA (YjgF/YER057c/UK114 family) [Kribbella sp. VKM Ac-2569]